MITPTPFFLLTLSAQLIIIANFPDLNISKNCANAHCTLCTLYTIYRHHYYNSDQNQKTEKEKNAIKKYENASTKSNSFRWIWAWNWNHSLRPSSELTVNKSKVISRAAWPPFIKDET